MSDTSTNKLKSPALNIVGYVIGFTVVSLIIYFINSPNTSSVSKKIRFDDTYRANFLQQCKTNGGKPEECTCSLNYLESNYEQEYLERLEQKYINTGNPPDALVDALNGAISYCTQ